MRGINRVLLSGNVSGRILFQDTGSGTACCGFTLASDRYTESDIVTAWIKVNVYGEGLVGACKQKLVKGCYVIVDGELMNRTGQHGELTEVRAREIVFCG